MNPWPPPRNATMPPAWRSEHTAHLHTAEIRLAQVHLDLKVDEIEGPIVGLLVGEAPSQNTSAMLPLFPWPERSSGGRLRRFGGVTVGQYLGRLRRCNLDDDSERWDLDRARAAADKVHARVQLDLEWRRALRYDALIAAAGSPPTHEEIADAMAEAGKIDPLRVLLLGARVSKAFGIDLPFQETTYDGITYRNIPHPSARNPIYNSERDRVAAGIAVRWAAGYLGGLPEVSAPSSAGADPAGVNS